MQRCPACDARLYDGVAWCGLCGSRILGASEVDDLLAEATAPGSRRAVLPQWQPSERHVAPAPEPHYSRWKGGPLSLGPRGKIAVSIGAFLIGVYFLLYAGSPGSGLVILSALPLFFRDVWRRRRIR